MEGVEINEKVEPNLPFFTTHKRVPVNHYFERLSFANVFEILLGLSMLTHGINQNV